MNPIERLAHHIKNKQKRERSFERGEYRRAITAAMPPTLPSAKSYANSQVLTVPAAINFDIPAWDDASAISLSYQSTPWQFIAPSTGEYLVNCSVSLARASPLTWTDGSELKLYFRVNGYTDEFDLDGRTLDAEGAWGEERRLTGVNVARLSQGDTVTVYVDYTAGDVQISIPGSLRSYVWIRQMAAL